MICLLILTKIVKIYRNPKNIALFDQPTEKFEVLEQFMNRYDKIYRKISKNYEIWPFYINLDFLAIFGYSQLTVVPRGKPGTMS